MRGRAGKQPTAYLLCQDEELQADLAEDVIDFGWHFRHFDGIDALTGAWLDASPSCVLLDLHQPVDGKTLFELHRLHQQQPHAALVPMLLVADDGSELALESDADVTLTLPYELETLSLLMDTVNDSRAAEQPALNRGRGRVADETPLDEPIAAYEDLEEELSADGVLYEGVVYADAELDGCYDDLAGVREFDFGVDLLSSLTPTEFAAGASWVNDGPTHPDVPLGAPQAAPQSARAPQPTEPPVTSTPVRASAQATVEVEAVVVEATATVASVARLRPPTTPVTRTQRITGQVLVLIADADPDVVALLAAHGEQAGWSVCTATDGRQAEWLLRSGTVDVAILGSSLNAGHGLDIVPRLHADGVCTQTRFVALSTEDRPEQMMAAFRAGYVEYIVKPFDPKVAAARIEQVASAIRRNRERALRIAAHQPVEVEGTAALELKPMEWALMVGSVLFGVGVSIGLASLTF